MVFDSAATAPTQPSQLSQPGQPGRPGQAGQAALPAHGAEMGALGSFQNAAALDAAGESRDYKGFFIAFEGPDGCGKSTQVAAIKDWLESRGAAVVATREPGGTELGVSLRQILLHSPHPVDPRCEALLFAADRAQHVAQVIAPALARGEVVITDRYIASSVAYQGQGRCLGAGDIADLSRWATGGLIPDVTILLDADPQQLLARLEREHDRMESAGLEFQKQVRARFRALAEQDRTMRVVDALQPPSQVTQQIIAIIEPLLAQKMDLQEGERGAENIGTVAAPDGAASADSFPKTGLDVPPLSTAEEHHP